MAKDLSDVNPDDGQLSPEQQRLMLLRDYLELLLKGLAMNNGDARSTWGKDNVDVAMWLNVAITEVESDVMHLQCDQEEYCRWGDAKDLTECAINE